MSRDDESVLVIPTSILFEKGEWRGLKRDNLDYYLDLVKQHAVFKRRGDVENDPSFQQLIPFIVFSHEKKYFMYHYLPKAGEPRLVNTYQLAVGGHINPVDGAGENILELGMKREWDEEVDFRGKILSQKFVGVLKDNTTMVEQVHVGMIYHFEGDSGDISIKETDKMQGEMVDLETLQKNVAANPNSYWMQILYRDYISKL